jgi:hypothetical protein
MELPVVQAINLVESANFDWLDEVFQGSIPTEIQDDDTKTVALITEYLSEPTSFGNSRFKGWQIGVEMQIFYEKKANFNLLEAEINMATLFEKDGWLIEQSKNHIKDPDTKQLSKVFYFTKKLRLEKEAA